MNTKFHPQWLGLTAVLFLLLAALAPGSPAHADSCLVTTDADSGVGSLREKIVDPVCEAISFDGDYTIVLASQLIIDRNVTIDGLGHIVTVSGNNAVRGFLVNSGATVSLNNLTVVNGVHHDEGGGVLNWGTLNVTNATFSGNHTQYGGGGIFNRGALNVMNSTFSGNYVDSLGCGGGICNWDGTLDVTNCTFSDNWAMSGDSIFNHDLGTLHVTNSTFGGGGMLNHGTATVTNSTFSGTYGGIENSIGTTTVVNTIVANTTILDNCTNWNGGGIIGSNSLADDDSCPGFTNSSSILLGPLADNGGPTLTMALLPGSAAIDAGDDAVCPATDQRSVTRPQGAHCDIGAYEAEITAGNTAPTANPGGPYLGAINTAIAFDGTGSSDPDGDPLTYAWTFDGGGTGMGVAPEHTYIAAGVYDVCLTVNDGTVDSPQACTLAVVYDPSAGFVTGGGWINSPAGAYEPDPNLSGRATFGFISKYKKGAQVPTGTTAFQFDAAGFSFYSEAYEWLVVNQGGTNAQFKGSGMVNGELAPNGNPYKFMLWAGDGATSGGSDTLRIRIWWEDAAGEHDVYDNGTAQAIGGGNIVVHTGK
jgi:hypothetical protein